MDLVRGVAFGEEALCHLKFSFRIWKDSFIIWPKKKSNSLLIIQKGLL